MKKFYKTIFLFLITYHLLLITCFSQNAPGIEWQNTIGGGEDDRSPSIQQTFDGGYIIGGWSRSNASGDKTQDNWDTTLSTYDYWIVKLNSVGSLEWQKSYGGDNDDRLNSIQQTTDGGYILGGRSNSNISGNKTENCIGSTDFWIIKLDSSGNIQFQNTIGGNDYEELCSIRQTSDGNYIVGGRSSSNISGDKTENSLGSEDYWVLKLDSTGNILWQNTIGGNSVEYLFACETTLDGGCILAGSSLSNASGDKTENCMGYCDYWIVKVDSTGNVQWENTIGGNNADYVRSVKQTSDGGYILGGYSNSNISGDKVEDCLGSDDYWIMKLDTSGNIQWQNTIGGIATEWVNSIRQTNDGGFIIGGYSDSNISGDKTENSLGTFDYWVIKLDSLGNIKWQNTIGGNHSDFLFGAQQTNDGGYILGGYSSSNISGDKTEDTLGGNDYWIVKLAPDTITTINQFPNYQFPISVSPNPITDKLNVMVNSKELSEITIYDITARKLLHQQFTNTLTLNTSHLSKGIYIYEVRPVPFSSGNKNGVIKKGKVVKD